MSSDGKSSHGLWQGEVKTKENDSRMKKETGFSGQFD
jgi:hypothetical protein